MALLAGDRLLHLIHDQHHIALGLIHHLAEGLRQGGATGCPQLLQRLAHSGLHQDRGTGSGVAPEIHIDHHRPLGFQFRHQVGAQEGGLAGASHPGQEQAGAQPLIQHPRPQQAAGQLSGQAGAAVDLRHALVASRGEA